MPQPRPKSLGACLLGGKSLGVRGGTLRPPVRFAPFYSVNTRVMKRSPNRASVFSMRRMSMRSFPTPTITPTSFRYPRSRRLSPPRHPDSLAAGNVHQRAHAFDGLAETAEIASPMRKWPMLSSTTAGKRATAPTVLKVKP